MDRYSNLTGAFFVSPLPGNTQIAVTHGLFIKPEYRGKGHGKALNETQLKCLEKSLFDYAICTVRADNAKQIRILEKAGYKRLDFFISRQTDAVTEIWGINL